MRADRLNVSFKNVQNAVSQLPEWIKHTTFTLGRKNDFESDVLPKYCICKTARQYWHARLVLYWTWSLWATSHYEQTFLGTWLIAEELWAELNLQKRASLN